jgi:malate synthase
MNFKVYSDNLLNFSEETTERYQILTDEAMTFLSLLHNFNPQRLVLLENQKKQQALFDAGAYLLFS